MNQIKAVELDATLHPEEDALRHAFAENPDIDRLVGAARKVGMAYPMIVRLLTTFGDKFPQALHLALCCLSTPAPPAEIPKARR